ncbi:EndoU domain-containing protein [Corynebacterium pseudodiphtheriticum]|uniref:EndoU domain-containing protein n=1 Tax=Corynebacterium pseudodiphtheriticum TaxID=37637 RepID=UPI00330624F3
MPLHLASTRAGHRWDSQRPGASKFPREWSDQKIVDTVRDLLESEEVKARKKGKKRTILGRIDGVKMRAAYYIINDRATGLTAYPVSGKGVTRNE